LDEGTILQSDRRRGKEVHVAISGRLPDRSQRTTAWGSVHPQRSLQRRAYPLGQVLLRQNTGADVHRKRDACLR